MDQAEATGLGVAFLGHAGLLALLTLGFAATVESPRIQDSVEVQFVEEISLEPSVAPPAPAGEPLPPTEPEQIVDQPPVPETQVVPRVQPVPEPPAPAPPVPRPVPAPRPKAVAPPRPKAVEQRPQPRVQSPSQPAAKARPTNRLAGLLKGVKDAEPRRETAASTATISAAARSSLGNEIRRQVKPHWKAPTGADAELLRTELSISLSRSGSVTGIDVVRTTGQTASNRPQVKLHQEQATRAVRLAAPFHLPAEFYDAWKQITISFDKRLSQ